MINQYKFFRSRPANSVVLNELFTKNEYEREDPNYDFQDCLVHLYQIIQNQTYDEAIPIFEEMRSIISKYDNIDYTNLAELNIFNIFNEFIEFMGEENYESSTELVIGIIIIIFYQIRTEFAIDFTSHILCKNLAGNINIPILNLFSIIIGDSEKVNENLVKYDLIENLLNLDIKNNIKNNEEEEEEEANENGDDDDEVIEFRRLKFLLFANYALTFNLEEDIMQCQEVVNKCAMKIVDEKDDECYSYRILCISRAIKRSIQILNLLFNTDMVKYIDYIVLNENNENRVKECLQLLEVMLSNANDFEEKISNELSLQNLFQKVTNFNEVSFFALRCITCLITYSDIFPLELYLDLQFPQLIDDVLTKESPFKMKKYALICINNFLSCFKRSLQSVFTVDMIDHIVDCIMPFTFEKDKDDFQSIFNILYMIIYENISDYFEDIFNFLIGLGEESADCNPEISEKCKFLMNFIEEQANPDK